MILFRKIIVVHFENHMKHVNALGRKIAGVINIKVDGTYSNHCG
jgi:hypothetical protein